MAIVMNMSSYVIEEPSLSETGCDERVRSSGWNPQLELATQQHLVTLVEGYAKLPASLLNADAEMFLQKMHAYQC